MRPMTRRKMPVYRTLVLVKKTSDRGAEDDEDAVFGED